MFLNFYLFSILYFFSFTLFFFFYKFLVFDVVIAALATFWNVYRNWKIRMNAFSAKYMYICSSLIAVYSSINLNNLWFRLIMAAAAYRLSLYIHSAALGIHFMHDLPSPHKQAGRMSDVARHKCSVLPLLWLYSIAACAVFGVPTTDIGCVYCTCCHTGS